MGGGGGDLGFPEAEAFSAVPCSSAERLSSIASSRSALLFRFFVFFLFSYGYKYLIRICFVRKSELSMGW